MNTRKTKSLLALSTAILLAITGCSKEETTPISHDIEDILLDSTIVDMAVDEVKEIKKENDRRIKVLSYSEEDFVLEIHDMLEKYGMTYQDLLELVLNTPEYKQALQDILELNPNLTTDKLMAILQGKDTNLRENLYVGDSRTQGMLVSELIDEDIAVYGIGYGYNWFIGDGKFSSDKTNALNGGIDGLESKMDDNECYNIVIWLGVNDYACVDAKTYFEKFKELAMNDWSNHNIYIVSVGPVNDSVTVYVDNEGINDFNDDLKDLVNNSSLDNLYYIDLNLNEDSINHYDAIGLHYGTSDNQNIFNIINEETTNTDVNDVTSILGIFYNALNSYGETFSNYSTDEVITQRR